MAFLRSMALGIAIRVTTGTARATIGGLKGAFRDLNKEGNKARAMGLGVAGVLTSVGAAGAIAAGGIGLALRQSAAFEHQMQAVRAVAGGMADDEFERLNQVALRLGRTTKFTAIEAAEGMEILQKAGLDAGQTIEGVLSASAAAGESVDRVASIISATVKGMASARKEVEGETVTQFTQRISDVLALASTKSRATISTLGVAMGRFGPQANQFNMGIEEAVAAVALLQDAGIDASESGNSMRNMLIRLTGPTKKSREVFKKYGISVEDAQGNMKSMRDIIAELSRGFRATNGNMEEARVLADAFGLRALKAAQITALANEDAVGSFDNLLNALQSADGAAKEMAETRLDSMIGRLELLRSAVGGFAIEFGRRLFGESLSPAIEGISNFINDITDGLTGLSQEGLGAQIGIGIGKAFEIAKAGVEGFMNAMSGLGIGGESGQAIGMVVTLVGLAAAALSPFLLLLAPIIAGVSMLSVGALKVLAVFGLLGAFIAANMPTFAEHFDYLSFVFGEVVTKITEMFQPAIKLLKSAFDDLVVAFQQVFSDGSITSVTGTASAIGHIAILVGRVAASLASMVGLAIKFASALIRFVSPVVRWIIQGFGYIASVVNGVMDMIGESEEKRIRLLTSVDDPTQNLAEEIKDFKSGEKEATVSSPKVEVSNNNTNKFEGEITTKVNIDGRELSSAIARDRIRFEDRAGFETTPWQRGQMKDLGHGGV